MKKGFYCVPPCLLVDVIKSFDDDVEIPYYLFERSLRVITIG